MSQWVLPQFTSSALSCRGALWEEQKEWDGFGVGNPHGFGIQEPKRIPPTLGSTLRSNSGGMGHSEPHMEGPMGAATHRDPHGIRSEKSLKSPSPSPNPLGKLPHRPHSPLAATEDGAGCGAVAPVLARLGAVLALGDVGVELGNGGLPLALVLWERGRNSLGNAVRVWDELNGIGAAVLGNGDLIALWSCSPIPRDGIGGTSLQERFRQTLG